MPGLLEQEARDRAMHVVTVESAPVVRDRRDWHRLVCAHSQFSIARYRAAAAHPLSDPVWFGGIHFSLSITPAVDKPSTHSAGLWMAPAGSVT